MRGLHIDMTRNLSKQSQRREASDPVTSPERLAELAKSDLALTRLVAANEGAPGELLAELSEHGDRAVRRRVVRNPATPAHTAARAGSEFPNDLLDNPAFDLYMIENPDLLTRFGEDDAGVFCNEGTLRALLKREECPKSFWTYAAEIGDTHTLLALLSNPNISREMLDSIRLRENWFWLPDGSQLPSDRQAVVLEACALHKASGAPLPDWQASLEAAFAAARLHHQGRGRIFSGLIEALARIDYALGNQDAELISPIQLDDLRTDSLRQVAFASATGRVEIAKLPTSGNHLKIPHEILRRLVENVDGITATELLRNPDAAPLWTSATLATAIRLMIPRPYDYTEQWHPFLNGWDGHFNDWDHLPATLLAGLPLPEFDEAVAIGLRRLAALPDDVEPFMATHRTRQALASHTSATTTLLERMIELEPRAVASNPATPAALLYRLAATEVWAIAENPSTPPTLLVKLALSAEENLKAALARDPNYLADFPPIGIPAFSMWRDTHPAAVGIALAARVAESNQLLTILSNSVDRVVRAGVKAVEINARRANHPRQVEREKARADQEALWEAWRAVRDERAQRRQNTLEKLFAKNDLEVLMQMANRPSVPKAAKVRALEILAKAGHDGTGRKATLFAAGHRTTPWRCLQELLGSEDIEIRNRASTTMAFAMRTRPREAQRIDAALEAEDSTTALASLKAELIDRMAGLIPPSLPRLIAFLHPDCPPGRLARAQRSIWWPERCAIASHPKTPLSAVSRLAEDANVVVRAAAREELTRRGMEVEA